MGGGKRGGPTSWTVAANRRQRPTSPKTGQKRGTRSKDVSPAQAKTGLEWSTRRVTHFKPLTSYKSEKCRL